VKNTEIELKFPVPPDFDLKLDSLLQKNHYFQPSDTLSVRTRFTHGFPAELVAKKGADPVNGTDRIEYTIATHSSIENLDMFVKDIMGFPVWANWARMRQQTEVSGFPVCLDINSGYGPILEIEGSDLDSILAFANKEFSLSYHLSKDDLKAFTNEYVDSWRDYYYPFLEGDRTLLNSRQELNNRLFN
jgi:hypothetical protein